MLPYYGLCVHFNEHWLHYIVASRHTRFSQLSVPGLITPDSTVHMRTATNHSYCTAYQMARSANTVKCDRRASAQDVMT